MRKRIPVISAMILLLLLFCLPYWYFSKVQKENWERVVVQKVDLSPGMNIRAWGAFHTKAILAGNDYANVNTAKVDSVKLPDGSIETYLWSPKASNQLCFKWGKGIVELGDNNRVSLELGESPPGEQFNNITTSFSGTTLTTNDLAVMGYDDTSLKKTIVFKIPYKHAGYSLLGCYASLHDHLAVAPKIRDESGELAGFLIFDYRKGRLLTEISMPNGTYGGRPYFSIDYKQKILVAVAYNLDSIVTVDLMSFYTQAGTE